VIPEKPKTWNGWFSEPTFRDFSNLTIKFEEDICVVITRYFLGNGIPDLKQSPYLRSWKPEGRVCAKWRVLNQQNVINVLSDGKCHNFYIQTEHCAVEVIPLDQTGRNRLGSCQMHRTAFCLSGHVMSPPEMFEKEDSTEEEPTPVTSSVLTTEFSILAVSRNIVLNENVDGPMSGVGVVRTENSDIALRRREGYAVSEDSREYRPNERSIESDSPSSVASHPQNDDHPTG
jgi:hypothetical protein